MIDTRFSTALQIATSVAVNDELGVRTTSESLANSTNTNASFIRKLVVPLRDAGILSVTLGSGGGIRLARPPKDILLSEIYTAAASERKIWELRDSIPCDCLVSRNISTFSAGLREEAEEKVMRHLSSVTLRDAVDKLQQLDTAPETQGQRMSG